MIAVRNVRDFVRINGEEVKRFYQYKTGIRDSDIVQDNLQEFYKKLMTSRALETFDESKGSFDTYIFNQLCWLLPYLAKKNSRLRHPAISYVSVVKKGMETEEDVYDFVAHEYSMFKIDYQFSSHFHDYEEAVATKDYIRRFQNFIKDTETPNEASQMITFINQKKVGCRSCEIARLLNITDSRVNQIKRKLKSKYELWQKVTELA